MRFSVNIPNYGDFADARAVTSPAVAAEEAGWDALFIWDHVVHTKRTRASFGGRSSWPGRWPRSTGSAGAA
ncbi:hypothetical protein [Streptomyces sp. KLMMK]|uniref:hypothetical protein n=1 Tax=Streptomyces sp. KLMMK TaxID=3109353 RepID=UPI003FA6FE81